MKPSPDRLQLELYPFRMEIAPRFGDMDPLRHLNNVALAGMYEEGRVRFGSALYPLRLQGRGYRLVIAEVSIRYLAESHYPAPLTIGVGVLRIGGAAHTLGQGLFQGGRCVGVCDTVLVHTAEGRPSPIPDALRATLTDNLLATGEQQDLPGELAANPVPER